MYNTNNNRYNQLSTDRQNSRSRNKKNKRKQHIQRNNNIFLYYDNDVNKANNKAHLNKEQQGQQKKRRPKHHYNSNQKIVRVVQNVHIPNPQSFIICQNPKFRDINLNKFQLKIEKAIQHPARSSTQADLLKNDITPISSIWQSHIKQYLNDSQFVQIYRHGKSLSHGNIRYGKSIINYHQQESTSQDDSKQSRIFSRAYFKLWEILVSQQVFKGKEGQILNIGSVAEGPGGFIHALIDYRMKFHNMKDNYYGITLKIDQNTRNAKDWSHPQAKDYFTQKIKLGYKIKLSYGKDQTGNLLNKQNIDFFAKNDLQNKKCYLVTGDGGIQCKSDDEYSYQQIFNAKLFLGQIITALKIQQLGGKFILKIYDIQFQLTRQLILILCSIYKRVKILKPITSRPGNSQKYLFCQQFMGLHSEERQILNHLLLMWTTIEPNISYFQNKLFVTNLLDFANFVNYTDVIQNIKTAKNHFLKDQAYKLQQGLSLATQAQNDRQQLQEILNTHRYQQQINFSYSWCAKYRIPSIKVYTLNNQLQFNNEE